MNLKDFDKGSATLDIKEKDLSTINSWILYELDLTIERVNDSLRKFRFSDACQVLQHFIWGEFCDWYLEFQKPVFYGDRGKKEKKASQKVLFYLMDKMLKILHPIMPFITEEIWQNLRPYSIEAMPASIMLADWPKTRGDRRKGDGDRREATDDGKPARGNRREGRASSGRTKTVNSLKEMISSVRDKKTRYQIPPSKAVIVVLKPLKGSFAEDIHRHTEDIKNLAKVSKVLLDENFQKEKGWLRLNVPSALHDFESYAFLGDSFDIEKEKEKLKKELDRLQNFITGIEKKLQNESFVRKAPEDVVAKEKQKKDDLALKIQNIETEIAEL